jgi:hypothetical protein
MQKLSKILLCARLTACSFASCRHSLPVAGHRALEVIQVLTFQRGSPYTSSLRNFQLQAKGPKERKIIVDLASLADGSVEGDLVDDKTAV